MLNLSASFVSRHSKEYFIENLSTLVGSGMTMLEAIEAVKADIRSSHMRAIIDRIAENIEAGLPLWRALDESHILPLHTISLIKVGEESGKLAENLRLVSIQEEKDRSFRSKIRSAMMYPVFVLSLTLIIGVGIAWFILPKLATVFGQLKLNLPLVTRVLIDVGRFLGERGLEAVPVFILLVVGLGYLMFYSPRTKIIGQTILFSLPGIKKLIQEVELARFGYLLGTLLRAGIPVTQAIHSLTEATFFPHYKHFYEHLERSIEEGNSFQKSFAAYPHLNRLIPTPFQQLIVTGERSGNLPEMLLSMSETFENKTELTTKNLTVILEPILLVIVWLGVVSVALAVILPIYSLIGNL